MSPETEGWIYLAGVLIGVLLFLSAVGGVLAFLVRVLEDDEPKGPHDS